MATIGVAPAKAPATRLLPEAAARRERDWAEYEFRCQVAVWLRQQGCAWPAATDDLVWQLDGTQAAVRHYATAPSRRPRSAWLAFLRAMVRRIGR